MPFLLLLVVVAEQLSCPHISSEFHDQTAAGENPDSNLALALRDQQSVIPFTQFLSDFFPCFISLHHAPPRRRSFHGGVLHAKNI